MHDYRPVFFLIMCVYKNLCEILICRVKFYVRKKYARKQFPLLRKIILLRCLFTYV